MSKAQKALFIVIPLLLLSAFAAFAVLSQRAALPAVIGAAAYLLLFAFAALACTDGFLSFFKEPDAPPPSSLLGERSRLRVHQTGKIIVYSFLAQLVFIIIAYILNNLANGFHATVFHWYEGAFVNGGIEASAVSSEAAAAQLAVVPFLPELLKLISKLTGAGIEIPAFILNTFAVSGLSVILYEIMLLDYDKKSSEFAVALLFVSPAAVYMMLPLSGNALFLLLTLLMFLLIRKGRLFFGGLSAALAAAVNAFGLLFFLPFLIEVIRAFILKRRSENKAEHLKIAAEAVFSMLPPLALLIFTLITYLKTSGNGLPFRYLYPEGFRFFFEAFTAPLTSIFEGKFTFSALYRLLPPLALGIVLCACISKIRASYALACLLLFAFAPTLFGGDMFPFASALFPVLPALFGAKVKTKSLRIIFGVLTFLVQLLFIAAVFVKGGI